MSLRLGAIAITFLLFTVPLFGSRALASEAQAVVDRHETVVTLQEPDGPEVIPAAEGVSNTFNESHSQPQVPPAAFPDAETPSISREAGLQKLSTLKGLPCLRDLHQDECTLTYAYSAIEFHAIGEEVIARFQRLNGTVNDADVIVMSSHIEDAALNDRINLDESPVIFAQFQQLSGARYEIPKTASEIKRSLGFSEDTPIAAVDWFEILKVHLERTLSTTPTVSDLILDLLGVELNPVVVETN